MNSQKTHAFEQKFPISNEHKQEWKEKSPDKSLLFHSLKHKLINEKEYFRWAIDHYQIPKVKNIYFEEQLIKQDDWNQIKEVHDWTEELLPIALWNDTIFIGCLELNDTVPKKVLGFDTRIVLVSYKNLEETWKFCNTLSDFIEKTKTGFPLENTGLKEDYREPLKVTPLKKEIHLEAQATLESPLESQEKLKSTFEPDLPDKKKPYPQPFLKQNSHQNLPEEENLRQSESNIVTFLGRHIEEPIMKGTLMGKKKDEKTPFEKSKWTFTSESISQLNKTEEYNSLWNYTKKHYCSSLIFTVKDKKAYLDSFVGRVSLKSTDKVCVDFKDHTFFKVIQRGNPYNGFTVETPDNKKFFSSLGWDSYPQFTTGIPIKDDMNNIKKIFIGFSLRTFSKQEIQMIQTDILRIFQEKEKVFFRN